MKLFSKVLFIIAVALLNSGCCLIGFTIGKISDSGTPPFTQISYPDTQAVIEQARTITLVLKPGREVVVTTRDNRQISGKYQGVEGSQEDLALKISEADASVSVPIRDISEIQMKNSRNGALTGFLVGAVVDGAVLVIATIVTQDAYEGFSPDLQL